MKPPTPLEDAIACGRIRPIEPVPPADDRDLRGRFRPGCAAGPGRPPGSKAIDLRAVAHAAAQDEGFDLHGALWGVVRTLVDAAQDGDVAAARLILDRLCGRDLQPVAVVGASLEELILAASGELAFEHDDDPPPPRGTTEGL